MSIKQKAVFHSKFFYKPDEDIFQYFLSETGLKSKECLFVDDAERNISTAKKLGFQTHQYVDFKTFKKFIQLLIE